MHRIMDMLKSLKKPKPVKIENFRMLCFRGSKNLRFLKTVGFCEHERILKLNLVKYIMIF